jgi:hypothetical protein
MPLPYTTEQNVIKIVNEKLKDQPIDKDAIVNVVNEAIESGEIEAGGSKVVANPNETYYDGRISLKTIEINGHIYQPNISGYRIYSGLYFDTDNLVDGSTYIYFNPVVSNFSVVMGSESHDTPYGQLITTLNELIDLFNQQFGTSIAHINNLNHGGTQLRDAILQINPQLVISAMALCYVNFSNAFKNLGNAEYTDELGIRRVAPILYYNYNIDTTNQMYTSLTIYYYDHTGTIQSTAFTSNTYFSCTVENSKDFSGLLLENNYY